MLVNNIGKNYKNTQFIMMWLGGKKRMILLSLSYDIVKLLSEIRFGKENE